LAAPNLHLISDGAPVVLSVGLAACLGIAGLAKLCGDRRAAVTGLLPGLTGRWRGALALGIPVVELFVAVLVAVAPTARLGALLSAGMLAGFTVLVAGNLVRGRRPPCGCFGVHDIRPIGGRTLARNSALFGAAAYLAATGVPRLGAAVAVASSLMTFTLVHAWFTVYLLRRDAGNTDRVARSWQAGGRPEPPVEARNPVLSRLGGGTILVNDLLRAGRPLWLLFADPDCAPCRRLMPSVRKWQSMPATELTLVVISRDIESAAALARQFELDGAAVDVGGAAAAQYGVQGTPTAVFIRVDGVVDSVTIGEDNIRAAADVLLPSAAVVPETAPQPAPGQLGLSLTGEPVLAADPAGRPTVVATWVSGCEECDLVAAAVKRLSATQSMRVVLLASSVPPDVATGVTVACDPQLGAATSFGASGAPCLFVLDELGALTAAPAVGAATALMTVRVLADKGLPGQMPRSSSAVAVG
jgi:thiol-disulfide isomerase/thioredoxin